MSAVAVRSSLDCGPDRCHDVQVVWDADNSALTITYRVHFHVDYPSIVHRGRGLDPQTVVERVEIEVDGEWRPAQLNRKQREALRDVIELDEELNAPCSGG